MILKLLEGNGIFFLVDTVLCEMILQIGLFFSCYGNILLMQTSFASF